MKEKNKKEFLLSRNIVIIIVQVITSTFASFYIYKMGLLPAKYLLPIIGFIWILVLLFSLMLIKTKGKPKLNIFIKIISLILSLSLILGSRYAMKGGNLLNLVTGADKDTHVTSVVVLKDSVYNSMDDVKQMKFGVNRKMDNLNIEKSIPIFNEKYQFTPSLREYNTYIELNQNLLNGTDEVILLNEAHRSIMKEINPEFDKQTRVIGFVSYEEDNKLEKANVNVKEDTYSIYVTGIDTYGPVSSVARSDANMIMTVNPRENQILLTSIPRDYHVELASFGEYDKLTHAGIYGVNESVKTLENLLDIKIDYYLKVNFSSVEQIVDAMGGVEVYSPIEFDSMSSHINAGMNYLNGDQALAFVRERYNLPDGDNGRVRNQQELIKGLINKAISPSILVNFDQILASVGDSIQLSMSDSDLKSIIRNQLDSGSSWDIQQYQLSGTGSTSSSTYSMPGWDLYVMEPDYATVKTASDLIKEMENGSRIEVSR